MAILLSFVIDDIRTAALPWQADIPIDVSLLLCILAFSLDISLRIMKLPDYLWSFYFYLDLLATAAVLADLQFLVSALFSPCTSGLLRGHKVVGKAARLGACSFRLLGYIRKRISGKRGNLLRLRTEDESLLVEGHVAQVRPENSALQGISGLTPNIKRESTNTPVRHNKKKHTLGRLYHLPNPSPAPPKPAKKAPASPKQSKIGKRLAKRVVTLVVLLVLAITLAYTWLLEVGEVREKYGREEYGLKLLLEARESRHFGEYLEAFLERNAKDSDLLYVVQLEIPEVVNWGGVPNIRSTDLCYFSLFPAKIVLNASNKNRFLAIFSLCQTLVLSLFTLAIVVSLNADITNLLVFPLERMIMTVESLVKNPLNMFNLTPDLRKGLYDDRKRCCAVKKDYAHEEIRVLENAFRKIGVMLALVYGSAGSELITNCIQEANFNPLLPGHEILAIFSFVHIAHFSDLLERLNSSMLKYVNQIARLAHSQSEKYLGSVNRNLGDAFLLVWKFREEEGVHVAGKFQVNAFSETVKQTTSLALLSSIKTLSKVVRSQALSTAQANFPGPVLTFGFHVGWAYEGAIGSYFKIDASYLSPHVNIASRVESAAKQYGVHILASEEFYTRLDSQVQSFLRHIDTVELQGVALHMRLYSFDIHTQDLGKSNARPTKWKTDQKRRKLKDALDSQFIHTHELFTQSTEIALMRVHFKDLFFQAYRQGLELYIKGEWKQAAEAWENSCDLMDLMDGPTLNLLGFMRSRELMPPGNWKGVRCLTEK